MKGYYKHIYESENLDDNIKRYFSEKRDYEEDIRSYFAFIKERPPKSVSVLLSIVRTFLLDNDVEISNTFWHRLRRRRKGTRAITQDRVPTKEEFRRILSHLPLKIRALFLLLASSGMRVGEACQLKITDIDLSKSPTLVRIRGEYTKTGNSRITFISSEASELVEEWLKEQPAYVKRYVKKDLDRLFPFTKFSLNKKFHQALAKSGLDERDPVTNRYKIHPHVLRKFFRSELAKSISVDVVEALMGHEGYLTGVYRMYSNPEKELGELYLRGEENLLIYGQRQDGKIKVDYLSKIGALSIELEQKNKENMDIQLKLASFMKLKEELDTVYGDIMSSMNQ